MKRVLLATISLLLISSFTFGQAPGQPPGKSPTKQPRKVHRYGGFNCGQDPILSTDGSSADDFLSPGTTNYYLVHLKDGHSYSADVWDSLDTYINVTGPQITLLASGTCTPITTTTDVSSIDPDLSNDFSGRISWVQSGNADAVLSVNNPDQTYSYEYTVRITDTTMRNARWSTALGGAFSTHYGFLNATASAITGTLTLYQSDGAVYTVQVSIPASGEVFETVCGTGSPGCSSQNIQVPPDKAGFATFVFVGPPGAVTADGYFQAVQSGGIVIVPTAWAPKNSQH